MACSCPECGSEEILRLYSAFYVPVNRAGEDIAPGGFAEHESRTEFTNDYLCSTCSYHWNENGQCVHAGKHPPMKNMSDVMRQLYNCASKEHMRDIVEELERQFNKGQIDIDRQDWPKLSRAVVDTVLRLSGIISSSIH